MVIKFYCECGKKVSIPESNRDMTGKCPRCDEPISLIHTDYTTIEREPLLSVDIDGSSPADETACLGEAVPDKNSETDAVAPVKAPSGPAPADDGNDATRAVAKVDLHAVSPQAPEPNSLAGLAAEVDEEGDTDAISAEAVKASIVNAQKEHFDEEQGTSEFEPVKVDGAGTDAIDDPGTDEIGSSRGSTTDSIESSGTGRLLYKPEDSDDQVTFTLGSGVTMGRSKSADITLAEQGISREHCRIDYIDGKYIISDTGSTNGVRVNGKKTPKTALVKGDKLLIGKAVLFFME